MKSMYVHLWKKKSYRQNVVSALLGRLGDSIDMITFSWLMYDLSRSAAYTAIVFGVNMLPAILFSPFLGAIIERLSKKRLILCCDIGRCGVTVLILLLFWQEALLPWMLLAATFFNNALEAFRQPAAVCFLADTLKEEEYTHGVAFQESLSRICELIGMGAAGVLLSFLGMAVCLWLDAFSFFLCAVFISCVDVQEYSAQFAVTIKGEASRMLRQMKEGFHYMRARKQILFLCLLACILNALLVPLNSFQAAYISGLLEAPAYVLSVMSMAVSLGIAIGAFCYPILAKRCPIKPLLCITGISLGVYYLLLIWIASFTSLFLLTLMIACSSLLFGFSVGNASALSSAYFMRYVEKAYLARMSGVRSAIAGCSMPLLSFLAGGLSERIGILSIFFIFAAVTILLFAGMMFMKLFDDS